MYAACAVRLNAGLLAPPVMPGAAACAFAVSKTARAASTGSSLVIEVTGFLFFIWFIAALLVDVDLGHQPAEVFGIVCKVVEIGRVEIEHAARRIQRLVAGIQNHVERLAATQRDRVGV